MTGNVYYGELSHAKAIELAEASVRAAEFKLARARVWLAWLRTQEVQPGAAAANSARPPESTSP